MRKTLGGIPLWAYAVAVAGVGLIYLRQRKAAAAAAQANQAAAPAPAAASASATDPVLIAYQAGEASGVSSYSQGVGSGIGLVESILGQFPTVTPTGSGTTTSTGPPTPVPTPSGGAGTSGPSYLLLPSGKAEEAAAAAGDTVYLNVPSQPGTYGPGIVKGAKTAQWYALAGQPGVGGYVMQ